MDNENSKATKSKTIKKNVYQKFSAFKTNFFDSVKEGRKPDIEELLKEQECFIFYSDDVVVSEQGNYIVSTIHFVDSEAGEEITAKAVTKEFMEKTSADEKAEELWNNNSKRSRGFALKALLGYIDNLKGAEKKSAKEKEKVASPSVPSKSVTSDSTNVPVSPTPAKTPSEPKGGVPKGFKGFSK